MTSGELGDDGAISDLPWASVFDPANNIRALGEIQARGFRAATELVDRFVRMNRDREKHTTPTESGCARGETPKPATPLDAERLLATWQGIVGQLAQSLRGAQTSTQTEAAAFDLMNDNARGQVALEASEPGAVSTEVWLHNGGAIDLGKVRLRCSDLLAHDGTVIHSQMVRFEPDTVPMPARCSRGVTVEVDVADDLPPSCYRGTLLADGHADVWLPVVLTVNPQLS
jgi:hypothetical protein